MSAPATSARAESARRGSGAERPERPRTLLRRVLALVVVVAITVWSAIAVGVDPGELIRNGQNAAGTLIQLFQPDYTFIVATLPALGQTVQMAVIGTAVSAAIALPVSFWASRATNPSGPVLAAVRVVMNIVRAVPDLLYASLFVTLVGTGALSGILALVLFDLGILVKLVSEALDAADRGGQEAAIAAGATWGKANRAAMLPEVAPTYISQVIYVFELNIRASTVIGLVGAGGLGMLIDQVRTFYQYHYLALIIFEILVIIAALELLSDQVRRRLTR